MAPIGATKLVLSVIVLLLVYYMNAGRLFHTSISCNSALESFTSNLKKKLFHIAAMIYYFNHFYSTISIEGKALIFSIASDML